MTKIVPRVLTHTTPKHHTTPDTKPNMSVSSGKSGLAEVLKRPCSNAAQPKEYHSTIRPVYFAPELTAAITRRPAPTPARSVPRPVGQIIKRAADRCELGGVARAIMGLESRAVSFKAPAGCGKSTAFAWELFNATECAVVVLSPTETIAQGHVREMNGLGYFSSYVSPARMSVMSLSKTMGVIYTTAAGMIMRALSAQKDMTDMETSLVVVHDECHLVDAETHFLRTMWPDFRSVKKMITVSSYTMPTEPVDKDAGCHPAESPVVVAVPFRKETEISPADELSPGVPAPWAVENLRGKRTIMYLESDRIAAYVKMAYGNFLDSVTLRRHEGYSKLVEAEAMLRNAGPDGVLVIVDSAYHSGVKLMADQVIDFGYVRETVAGAGLQPVDRVVRATATERAVRVHSAVPPSGGDRPVKAYVPTEPAPDTAPVMGVGETAKVAAYCQLFGYSAPAQALPKRLPEKMERADTVDFLSSGLPWEIWVDTAYKEKPPDRAITPAALEALGNTRSLDVPGILDWVGSQRPVLQPVELSSGRSYADEQGSLGVDGTVIGTIKREYGDLFAWLRERIKGPSVRKFEDLSDFEAHTVWLVWLTAWNENVADLVALDKWRAVYGATVTEWRARADCRPKVARLFAIARDIHDKWMLLSGWYKEMFPIHPYRLSEVETGDELVDDRFSSLLRHLGHGDVVRHALGSSSIGVGVAHHHVRDRGLREEVAREVGVIRDPTRFIRYGGS